MLWNYDPIGNTGKVLLGNTGKVLLAEQKGQDIVYGDLSNLGNPEFELRHINEI